MRYYANIEGARKTNIRIKPTLLAHIFPEATSAWALGKSQGGDKVRSLFRTFVTV
jgi:hypothetical protein